MGAENDLASPLDDLHLRSRLVQAQLATDRGWYGDKPTALNCDEHTFVSHLNKASASTALLQY